MSFQMENGTITVFETGIKRAECPVDGDFLLPEYCPDMAAVLKCTVTPTVLSRQCNGDKLMIDGQSHIRILYLDEGRNCVRSYECVEPFGCAVQGACESLPKVTVQVNYMNCRAVSPRRIGVHGALTVQVYGDTCRSQSVVSAMGGRDVFSKKEAFCQTVPFGGAEKAFSIHETVDLGVGKPAAESVIRTGYQYTITSVKPMNDKAILKGRVVLKTLYRVDGGDGACECTQHDFPFSQIVELNGLREEMQVKGSLQVLSIAVEVTADPSGAGTLLLVNMKLCARMEAFTKEEMPVVCDAYMGKYPCYAEHTDLSSRVLDFVKCDTITVKESLEMPSETIAEILDVWCEPTSAVAVNKDGWRVEGSLPVCMLAKEQDGSISYYEHNTEYALPMAETCDHMDVEVSLSDMEYTVSAGNIEIRLDFAVSREGYTCRSYTVLTEFQQEAEPFPEERAALRICRVKKGDSVWEIAKQSHTDMAAVLAENHLQTDIVPEDMMLLVPLR